MLFPVVDQSLHEVSDNMELFCSPLAIPPITLSPLETATRCERGYSPHTTSIRRSCWSVTHEVFPAQQSRSSDVLNCCPVYLGTWLAADNLKCERQMLLAVMTAAVRSFVVVLVDCQSSSTCDAHSDLSIL